MSYKKISSFFSKIAVNLKSLVCLDLNHVIEKTRESMSEILHVFKKCQRSRVPSTWVFFFICIYWEAFRIVESSVTGMQNKKIYLVFFR